MNQDLTENIKKKILIIDDSKYFHNLYRGHLKNQGYIVYVANGFMAETRNPSLRDGNPTSKSPIQNKLPIP